MTLRVEIGGGDIGDYILIGAAVVQAVGSVAAIVAAILIARHDRAEALRAETAARVSGLAAIIFRAEDIVRKPWDEIEQDSWIGWARFFDEEVIPDWERRREQCLTALQAIPLHELQDWDLVSATLEMIEALIAVEPLIQRIRASNSPWVRPAGDGEVKVDGLASVVNLAAQAAARVHHVGHRSSHDRRARKTSFKPRYVA